MTMNSLYTNLDDYPSFSFEYLTNQSKFNFEYFKHDKTACEKAQAALIEKILLLSTFKWKELDNFSKKIGFELLPKNEVKVKLNHINKEVPEQFMVFRFFKEKYRIIGFKESNNPIYFIVGFDFDYEAYNHGK